MDEKSRETSSSFAQEIDLMSEDKILLLTFPFISSIFSMDFVKYFYNKLIPSIFGDEEQAWKFDKVVDWFKDDKIDIIPRWYPVKIEDIIPNWKGKNNIQFSHPSYYDALKNAISSSNKTVTKTGRILIKVLYILSYYKGFDAAGEVAYAVAYNFDKLPEHVRNELLLKLAENKYSAGAVAYAVSLHFDKLPEKVQNLLFKLVKNKVEADSVDSAIAYNFDKLPEHVRKKILKKFSLYQRTFFDLVSK